MQWPHPITLIGLALAIALVVLFDRQLDAINTANSQHALELAVLQNDYQVATYLIAEGAKLPSSHGGANSKQAHLRGRSEFFEARSLLFQVALNGRYEMAELLIRSFPDRYWQDHLAIKRLALSSRKSQLFELLMALCNKARSLYGNAFTYTLLEQGDLT